MTKIPTANATMLRFPDVIVQTGLSRTTIWRKVRRGHFPPPIQLGENSGGWPEDEIVAWVANRPRVQYAPSPETSAAQSRPSSSRT
jgi:prophage regulatory protein